MILEGRVHLFGHNVDTDAIIPARYLSAVTAEELAPFCMTDIRPGFADAVQQGDIIVAGKNFGCGSSREHAPLAIKGTGIACVVAHSFARIFYRNAINIGLPILECPEGAAVVCGLCTFWIVTWFNPWMNAVLGIAWYAVTLSVPQALEEQNA